jgi:cytochrome c551/c552
MWNRSTAAMGESYARKGVRHPQLTSLEMNDLLIFLENVPSIPSKEASFQFATCETGPALFTAKGCASCHKGKLSFGSRSAHSNMSDFAAAMWNHAIGGHQVRQPLSYGEMSGLVSYLWSVEAMGQERKGESVFQKKNCAACHDSQTLARSMVLHHRELLPFSLLTAMGSYSTEVTTDMSQKGVVWPQLTGPEMANLAEYLSVRTGAK